MPMCERCEGYVPADARCRCRKLLARWGGDDDDGAWTEVYAVSLVTAAQRFAEDRIDALAPLRAPRLVEVREGEDAPQLAEVAAHVSLGAKMVSPAAAAARRA